MLKWKELEEVLLDVEVTLNNRPLSYIEDEVQFPVLTPNTLLFENSNILPELETHHIVDGDLCRRAKHLLRCKEAVWKRWSREYLRSLRERHRAKIRAGPVPKVGDVVTISDNEKKKGEWTLGIVEKWVTGKDNEVRNYCETLKITLWESQSHPKHLCENTERELNKIQREMKKFLRKIEKESKLRD